jgi:hypothetical protein
MSDLFGMSFGRRDVCTFCDVLFGFTQPINGSTGRAAFERPGCVSSAGDVWKRVMKATGLSDQDVQCLIYYCYVMHIIN